MKNTIHNTTNFMTLIYRGNYAEAVKVNGSWHIRVRDEKDIDKWHIYSIFISHLRINEICKILAQTHIERPEILYSECITTPCMWVEGYTQTA